MQLLGSGVRVGGATRATTGGRTAPGCTMTPSRQNERKESDYFLNLLP